MEAAIAQDPEGKARIERAKERLDEAAATIGEGMLRETEPRGGEQASGSGIDPGERQERVEQVLAMERIEQQNKRKEPEQGEAERLQKRVMQEEPGGTSKRQGREEGDAMEVENEEEERRTKRQKEDDDQQMSALFRRIIMGVDITEVYSPERVVAMAKRMRLVGGSGHATSRPPVGKESRVISARRRNGGKPKTRLQNRSRTC